MLNALTVDVEDYYQVAGFSEAIAPSQWDRYPARVERNTEHLLQLFDDAGVTATFFVLGWIAERFPQLVRRIAAEGHEVASHGWGHRLIYNQHPAEFRSETRHAKGLLEDLAQHEVTGYRAASYSITRRSLWALDILIEEGFVYDSSIVPVVHDRYGIPGTEPWPHRIVRAGGALAEFPPSTVSVFGLTVPVSGGGYFRLYPYAVTRMALSHINGAGHPFMFYIHPWEIDPGQPRIKSRWSSRFRHYVNIRRCEGRLVRLLKEFRFAPAAQVLAGTALLARESHTRQDDRVQEELG